MLAFARRQELRPEPVDVALLVRDMADLLRRTLGPSVAVETRFPSDLKRVLVDSNQLELALLNLAVNARDAMPQGGSISIGAREEAAPAGDGHHLRPGRYVRLTITDTGEGMDEATLARAAEPFFTTKGVGKGTGLGLAMVHGIAEQSGGRLVLKSRKGEGATAELWLPLAETAVKAARQSERASEPEPRTVPLHVLAVDDDHLVLTNTVAMLEELGHSVSKAASGKQALHILRSNTVDLVITDQAMPGMTGGQLAEAVAADWPRLPVILATGYAEAPPGLLSYASRLAKPFGQSALAGAIADAMRSNINKS